MYQSLRRYLKGNSATEASNDSISLTITKKKLITPTRYRKVEPKITSMQRFNPRRGNKFNFMIDLIFQ